MGDEYTIFIEKNALKRFVNNRFQTNFDIFQSNLYFLYSRDRSWSIIIELMGVENADLFDGIFIYTELDKLIKNKKIAEIENFWIIPSLLSILKLFAPENVLIINDGLSDGREWWVLKERYYDLGDMYYWDFKYYSRLFYQFKHVVDFIRLLREFLKYDGDENKIIKKGGD